MLKFVFVLLLAANAALFAYHQGYLSAWFAEGREPARVARQIQAEKIRVLPQSAAAPTTTLPPAPAPAPASEPAQIEEPASAAQPQVVPVAAPEASQNAQLAACVEVGTFNDSEAARFDAQLAPLALGARLSRKTQQTSSGYIVFMPPQGSKEGADKKVSQLRALGVTEFFVVQDNPELRWGISLGVFRTEEAAKARLAKLNEQGVRTARVGPHNAVTRVTFQMRDIDAATRAAIDKIKQEFPQQEIRACS